MKKNLIIAAIVIFAAIGITYRYNQIQSEQASLIPQNPGAASSLTTDQTLYNFGTISMKDGLVTHVFKVTNPSDKDIFVRKVATSCMCTKAYIESAIGEQGPFGMEGMGYLPPANELIKAHESLDIKVVYDPNAHGPAGVGAIDRLIYLTDESGGNFTLEIKALVTP